MKHRYFNLHWWALRLADNLERVVPPQLVMNFIGATAIRGGEVELGCLSDFIAADKNAIDVGAANGVYSWSMRRFALGVHAFEANPRLHKKLVRRLPQINAHCCALSETCGQTELRIPLRKGSALSGHATIETANGLDDFDSVERVSVDMKTLDSFNLENIGFIKIDVEGHELSVLKGAEQLIMRDRPILLIEIEDRHRDDAFESVVRWLSERHFERLGIATSPQNHIFKSRR